MKLNFESMAVDILVEVEDVSFNQRFRCPCFFTAIESGSHSDIDHSRQDSVVSKLNLACVYSFRWNYLILLG